jgi:hypothetical protein
MDPPGSERTRLASSQLSLSVFGTAKHASQGETLSSYLTRRSATRTRSAFEPVTKPVCRHVVNVFCPDCSWMTGNSDRTLLMLRQ